MTLRVGAEMIKITRKLAESRDVTLFNSETWIQYQMNKMFKKITDIKAEKTK